MKASLSCTFAVALAVLSSSACSKPDPSPAWREVGPPGVGELRAVADCGGRWWVAGAPATGGPAAWTSTDGAVWQSVPFAALPGSYYGPREVITDVACSGDRVAMIGAVPGGAHGNPRVSSWRLDGGRMVENPAPFETYGGDTAVDVGRLAAGPAGFAIAGNRSSGAAAWLAPPGARVFTLFENAPGLAGATVARDAVALPDGRWAIVGGEARRGSADQRAAVWTTTDGRAWTRDDPPAEGGYNELQRAVRDGDDVVAAGARGTRFGLWRWHAGRWTTGQAFGGDPAGVRSMAVADGRTVVVGGGLFLDGRKIDSPEPPVAVAARGRQVLLVTRARLWLAQI
ncbi:hypothetical protein ODJ79_05180 [Actinoplanes sp. KI2]|uniref:hypothetical protein n=1 Tax=Actinoplanes sp. KI2 TaxID=2983315 RepID=UPI0021D5B5D4|nr:hypothetical protein [Actinoplanes sp. KI2]MCU7723100.1 hypothetical protein [Actinoplanes sp. KI2]